MRARNVRNCQNGNFNPKCLTSCEIWTNAPRDFFVGPAKLHMCTKFQNPRSKHGLRLMFLNFLGGAVEELGHAHQISHQISFGDWTRIHNMEFGADQMIYVEIRAKRMAMA
ncbi:hypothetical protein ILYODFUR_037403 [Ilyodon furcidens]|uniref:Uncharacterized protein n=1 Tax=Ilyodon furcidens TaxID=33524 RepID=A0ABV0UQ48_9TELE